MPRFNLLYKNTILHEKSNIFSFIFLLPNKVYSIKCMDLSEYLYILGLALVPFILYIGYSTKPRNGFYYLSFVIILALTLPSIITNGITLDLGIVSYLLISINASILALMLIGHWFLVDPTINRTGMKQVAKFGIASSALAMLNELISITNSTSLLSPLLDYVVAGLFLATCLLVSGANFSLNERGYSGVMAATGLSYLSFLTSIGAVGTLLLVS